MLLCPQLFLSRSDWEVQREDYGTLEQDHSKNKSSQKKIHQTYWETEPTEIPAPRERVENRNKAFQKRSSKRPDRKFGKKVFSRINSLNMYHDQT